MEKGVETAKAGSRIRCNGRKELKEDNIGYRCSSMARKLTVVQRGRKRRREEEGKEKRKYMVIGD